MITITSREARAIAAALDLACEIALMASDKEHPSIAAFLDAMAPLNIATLGAKLGRDVPQKLDAELLRWVQQKLGKEEW